jgi:hypothetical protein
MVVPCDDDDERCDDGGADSDSRARAAHRCMVTGAGMA